MKWIAGLLCALLLPAHVLAAQQSAELRISVGDWPPFLTTQLRHNGVMAHMISDIFADEGYRVSFVFLPWARAYADAADGKFDATAIWMRKAEREQEFIFSEPLLVEQFVFFHLKEKPFSWEKFSDLQGMKLGGGLEYSYGPEFDAYLASGQLLMERVPNSRQNFEKLLRKRIELYPEEIHVGYATLRSHFKPEDVEKITHAQKPLLNNLSYLMLPKQLAGSPALVERFNKRLQMYRDSGRYERYFEDLRTGKYDLPASEKTVN